MLLVFCTVIGLLVVVNGDDAFLRHILFGNDDLIDISASKLDVSFSNNYQNYDIMVNGDKWLSSSDIYLRNNNKDASLILNGTATKNGSDNLGSYSDFVLQYIDENDKSVQFDAIFRTYPSLSDIIIFIQSFPNLIKNTAVNNENDVISAFPSFQITDAEINNNKSELGYIHWSGGMAGSTPQYGKWSSNINDNKNLKGGIKNTGPLALFDKLLTNTLVISPLTFAMTANDMKTTNNTMRWGIQGLVTEIPSKFEISFIMTIPINGGGINIGMKHWGDTMLKYFNKPRGNAHKRDYTLNHLGYSTDHGAYYFYYQEPGKNGQDTIIDVKKYVVDELGLPVKYVLMDSWWYQQSGGHGDYHFDYNMSGNITLFPNGIEYVQKNTGWTFQTQNRPWAVDTWYQSLTNQNWTWYKNTTSGDSMVYSPTQPFWEYVFNNLYNWKFHVYEQDHLSQTQFDIKLILNTTYYGNDYIFGMGKAAEKYNLSIQYCMSFPRHILSSIQTISGTQARASGDYKPGCNNWNLGHNSIFTSALEIQPSKDSFWSKSDIQITGDRGECNKNNPCSEPHNRLMAVSLSLSNGPWTFADRIGYTDYDLIMKSCNSEGVLLRPSYSATCIDKYFLQKTNLIHNGPNGEVWSSVSIIDDNIYYYYIFAAELSNQFTIYPKDFIFDNNQVNQYLVYEANKTSDFMQFNNSNGIKIDKCGLYDFRLYTVVPIYGTVSNQWYLSGEIDKWITVSSQRFTKIKLINNGGISVNVIGGFNETINVAFVQYNTNKQQIVKCTIGESKTITITMPQATCS